MNNEKIFIKIKPAQVGLFRFLLEAYDNLAYFTVLEPKTALLKICYSPDLKVATHKALNDISSAVEIAYLDI